MLNKLKDGANKAGLEAEYVKRKATNSYPHSSDIAEIIVQLRHKETCVNKFKDHIQCITGTVKNCNEACATAASDFAFIADQASDAHLRIASKLYLALGDAKKKYYDDLFGILHEVNAFVAGELKKVLQVEENANRAAVEKDYYKNDKNHKQATEDKYKAASADLVDAIKDFVAKATASFEVWTKRVTDCEIAFHRNSEQAVPK
eukprot:TRINITY_DN4201_c0_g1_i1.p1 TRINITY_DN4201_c0_g1~~TRINITY_DN4201_c0_g1_i1.p1  ORF type:complete len:204 (-),score=50.44 TRINITY_DN4201_c0_g1_i1:80-691(-)